MRPGSAVGVRLGVERLTPIRLTVGGRVPSWWCVGRTWSSIWGCIDQGGASSLVLALRVEAPQRAYREPPRQFCRDLGPDPEFLGAGYRTVLERRADLRTGLQCGVRLWRLTSTHSAASADDEREARELFLPLALRSRSGAHCTISGKAGRPSGADIARA